jgi:transcription elongation factor Elf1
MEGINDRAVNCPHCGHHIHVWLDSSNGDQEYYEDCPACCNAIHVTFHIDDISKQLNLTLSTD